MTVQSRTGLGVYHSLIFTAAKGGLVEKNCSPNFCSSFSFVFYDALVWKLTEIFRSKPEAAATVVEIFLKSFFYEIE